MFEQQIETKQNVGKLRLRPKKFVMHQKHFFLFNRILSISFQCFSVDGDNNFDLNAHIGRASIKGRTELKEKR